MARRSATWAGSDRRNAGRQAGRRDCRRVIDLPEGGPDNSRMVSVLWRAAAVLGALAPCWRRACRAHRDRRRAHLRLRRRPRQPAATFLWKCRRRSETAAEVRRLLSDRCFRCHGPDAAKRKAKLRLDTREGLFAELEEGMAVVTPGDLDKSEMIRRIQLPADHDDVMPPADAHQALTAEEKALLARWVAEGAEYRGHWSWEPIAGLDVPAADGRLREPPLPTAPDGQRATAPDDGRLGEPSLPNPIDGFVRARLAKEGLAPARPAAPEIVLRRLSFNLTGLPPTPAEIDAFVADSHAGRLRPRRGPPARVARIRRTHGRRLARPRALRRHLRLPGRRHARHVAVPRLGDRRLQPQPAVRPVPDVATGRRPAAQRRRASSASRRRSTACTGRPTKAAASKRSSAPSTSPIA